MKSRHISAINFFSVNCFLVVKTVACGIKQVFEIDSLVDCIAYSKCILSKSIWWNNYDMYLHIYWIKRSPWTKEVYISFSFSDSYLSRTVSRSQKRSVWTPRTTPDESRNQLSKNGVIAHPTCWITPRPLAIRHQMYQEANSLPGETNISISRENGNAKTYIKCDLTTT